MIMNKTLMWLVLVLLALVLILITPLITIWALNTLFPALAIPYSIETWLATMILAAVLKTRVTTGK
jgi:hypothetical protein